MPTIEGIQIHWREIFPEEVEKIHHLHLAATRGMGRDLVRQDDLVQFQEHLEMHGKILGGFIDPQRLVAYGVIGFASRTRQNMAKLLRVTDKDLPRFCILDGASVATELRGHGLHAQLIEKRIQLAQAHGKTLFGVTVAPGNLPSLRGLLSRGFNIHALAFPYADAAPRLVMQKDSLHTVEAWESMMSVEVDDVFGHQTALAAGLIGCAGINRKNNLLFVSYKQKLF